MPWYYPSHGIDFDNEETTANLTAVAGNWGRKRIGDARWVRKGKMAAWGPNYEEWEVSLLHTPSKCTRNVIPSD